MAGQFGPAFGDLGIFGEHRFFMVHVHTSPLNTVTFQFHAVKQALSLFITSLSNDQPKEGWVDNGKLLQRNLATCPHFETNFPKNIQNSCLEQYDVSSPLRY